MPKAAWILHNYPPVVLAGAEFAAHRINLWLLKEGWTVRVYIVGQAAEYPAEFEGVPITCARNCYDLPIDSDTLLLSQLWAARQAHMVVDMKRLKYIEFVHYVDNTVVSPYPWTTRRDFLMVYNSLDTQKRALEIGGWLSTVKSVLMPPLITDVPASLSQVEEKRSARAEARWITLVNFSTDKGADIFNSCATMNEKEGREFVGIAGSHGQQEKPCARVQVLTATLDMESVWAKTRILVVPSKYETWSMVASEALLRGIPVVAADHIPALKENCGDGALYVPRDDVGAWLRALDTIEAEYEQYSQKARSVSLSKKPDQEANLRNIFYC
jgi:glycosyltransferase involved in cell wall biosynthesis